MADTMDISSSFAHHQNHGDDDIDIDIDLVVERVDEDHILEDIVSEAVADEDIELGDEPVVHLSDDRMIEDDNVSFRMEDAENFVDEIASEYGAGPDVLDTTAGQGSGVPQDHLQAPEPVPYEDGTDDWAPEHAVEESANAASSEINERDDGQVEAHVDATENVLAISEFQAANDEHEAPADRSPYRPTAQQSADEEVTVVRKSPSPPVSIAHVEALSNHDVNRQAADGPEANRKVVVLFQESEYALIALTDQDEPDSFFLPDDDLLHAPLTEFLPALRHVLGDDLSTDDELCLSIDDLGLEFTELYSAAANITFNDLVALHTTLLKNDGMDANGPLYVTLSAKPEFSKQLIHLRAGAAEGKGFAELGLWDDKSLHEDTEQASEEDGTANGDEKAFENAQHTEHGKASETAEHLANSQPQSTEIAPTEEQHDEGIVSEEHVRNIDEESSLHSEQEVEETTLDVEPVGIKQPEVDNISEEEHLHSNAPLPQEASLDEEGDLIDYDDEDDEYGDSGKANSYAPEHPTALLLAHGMDSQFFSPCLLPASCFCERCSELLLLEYEAIKEKLRRESLLGSTSPPFSDNLVVRPVAGGDYHLYKANRANTEVDSEHEAQDPEREPEKATHDLDDHVEEADATIGFENVIHDDLGETTSQNAIDYLDPINSESHGASIDTERDAIDAGLDEIDYEGDEGVDIQKEESSTEDVYDPVPEGLIDHLSASSDQTIVGDLLNEGALNPEDVEDEIDYDHDEPVDIANQPSAISASSGKRSRPEEEEDAGPHDSDSKRIRS